MARKKTARARNRGDGRTRSGQFAKGTSGRSFARRSDGFASQATGIGWGGVDKIGAHEICVDPVGPDEALAIWRGSDIAATIVEDPPNEMFREGYEYKTEDVDQTAAVVTEIKRLAINEQVKAAKEYERAYGGAALMPIAENMGANLAAPLDMSRFRPIRMSHFVLLEPRELTPASYYRAFGDPKYGWPETYRLTAVAPGSYSQVDVIHESRLIIFGGKKLTRRPQGGTLDGWQDSIFTRIKRSVQGFDVSWSAMENLIVSFGQAVLKIKGLADAVSEEGARALMNRVAGFDFARSVLRMMVIDENEEFEQQATPVSGLHELLDRVAQRLGAAAKMPLTRLLGISPGGLNATGESDIKTYDDRIAGEQSNTTCKIEQAIAFACAASDGPTGGEQIKGASLEWRPLRQPTDKEIAETRKTVAETDERYWQMGATSTEVIQNSRWGGQKYSMETVLDWPEIEKARAAPTDEELANLRTPGAMPGDPIATGRQNIQQTVLAGPQISALLEVITARNTKTISPESAENVLRVGFRLTPEEARAILGPEMADPTILVPGQPAAPAIVPVTPPAPAAKAPVVTPAKAP